MTNFRLVETYSYDGSIEIDGRTWPAVGLIEDEDGIRILFVANTEYFEIPVQDWVSAHASGAQAIIWASMPSPNLPPVVVFTTAANFMENRVELSSRLFGLGPRYWTEARTMIGYLEMVLDRGIPEITPAEPSGDDTHFVHLHTHSEFSALDGVSKLAEMLDAVVADGQKAVAVTDHGNCAVHPDLALEAAKHGVKAIFGMEAYFVHDRHLKGAEHRDYMHLGLLAMNDVGLRNLWAMSTESYRSGMYYKPRIDWELLERHAEGVIVTTACLRGPLMHPKAAGHEDEALANLAKLRRIFDDRVYIELHVNQLPIQITMNEWLVKLAEEQGIPLIAVVDSHYTHKHERDMHRTWLSIQTDSDVSDDSSLFAGGQDYHMMTADEVRANLSRQGMPMTVIDEAVANTGRLADRCTAEIRGKGVNPVYSKPTEAHPDPVAHDVDRLMDECLKRWAERTAGKGYSQKVYMERFEREMGLLITKGFCGYFLMVMLIVRHAKDNGVLVGPGRGSGGGSLVAYLVGITEIDPVEHDLLFERFMTEGRTSLPDFDLDFPSSRKQFMLDFIEATWGADSMATVGTHLRLKNKAAVRDTFRAMKSLLPEDHYTDVNAISKIIDEAEASTAGLGLSWEELWVQHGDELEPFRAKYPEVFTMIEKLHGRLKTYGKHAAGVIIDPVEVLTGALPLRGGEEGSGMITQWDMRALEALGYVKFDLLNIRTLDTIQQTVDLILQRRGYLVVPYGWREEYDDPYVWGEVSDGWTLGIFQIETASGTRLTKRFRPESLAHLADVVTLVRPGPRNSGLQGIYLSRHEGEEVTYPDPRMEEILSKTYGTMLYQEDIMAVTMTLAGYGSDEADEVRKILGKKKVELVAAAGEKFIRRAIEQGTDKDVAEHLWAQMAEFAKYSFNRAHAFAYAIIAYWTAWLKFHYPIEFLTAALSTVDQARVSEFVEEARRMDYQVLPPDINESGEGFTATDLAVRYGLKSIKGVGDAAVEAIVEPRPYTSYQDFLDRKGPKANSGVAKILVHIGAFDSLEPNRRGLEKVIEVESIGGSDRCSWKDTAHVNEYSLPCRFDWPSEDPGVGRTGKALKRKDPPKKCTKGCRQFTPIPPPNPAEIMSYTDEDIRQIEMEMLGVYLSSTPFDRLDPEDLASLATAVDVLTGPVGDYSCAVIVKGIRQKPGGDSSGRAMGWLKLGTVRGELDAVVFGSVWERVSHKFKVGALALVHLNKNQRGQSLTLFQSLDD